ncbi:PEF-CTERM protein sorting domain-containing protein [Methanolobus vulcani]|uniref:PEF-CTERM protein sorting domain-containing protein n=1 Tax=Methanolobus vulcani TaxID=38026 RepID=A0A7Z7FES9_9EURY|nr:PEF-CTERM sorting domain-containing protein [Methanolobus vulcani]MDK2826843.1 hypothetical protein [Methanolobus sp.]SDG04883.1 PEF-CTERM protein sorting domain-containing protein [Methanolobus vulcani]
MKKLIILALALAICTGLADASLTHTGRIYDETASGLAPNPINLLPGSSVILSYHAEKLTSSAMGLTTPYGYDILDVTGGGSVNDINITFTHNFTPTTYPEYDDVGVITLKLDSNAPVGAVYEVKIYTGTSSATCYASASRDVCAVPEFPTIALPIAAILGLAFIFTRRE